MVEIEAVLGSSKSIFSRFSIRLFFHYFSILDRQKERIDHAEHEFVRIISIGSTIVEIEAVLGSSKSIFSRFSIRRCFHSFSILDR